MVLWLAFINTESVHMMFFQMMLSPRAIAESMSQILREPQNFETNLQAGPYMTVYYTFGTGIQEALSACRDNALAPRRNTSLEILVLAPMSSVDTPWLCTLDLNGSCPTHTLAGAVSQAHQNVLSTLKLRYCKQCSRDGSAGSRGSDMGSELMR